MCRHLLTAGNAAFILTAAGSPHHLFISSLCPVLPLVPHCKYNTVNQILNIYSWAFRNSALCNYLRKHGFHNKTRVCARLSLSGTFPGFALFSFFFLLWTKLESRCIHKELLPSCCEKHLIYSLEQSLKVALYILFSRLCSLILGLWEFAVFRFQTSHQASGGGGCHYHMAFFFQSALYVSVSESAHCQSQHHFLSALTDSDAQPAEFVFSLVASTLTAMFNPPQKNK